MLFLISTAVMWGITLPALFACRWAWRERHRQPRQAACRGWFALTTLSLTVCFTLLQPPVYHLVDRVTGVPNSPRLLANLLAILAAWCVGRWLAAMPGPVLPRTRVARIAQSPGLALGTMLILATLWVIGPRGVTEADDYVAHYGTSAAVLGSRLVFCGYLGIVAAGLCRRAWAFRHAARRRLTRAALTLQTAGWASAVLYVLHEGGYAAIRYVEGSYSAAQAERAQGLLIAGATLPIAISQILPPVATRLLQLRRWLIRYRAYRRLGALSRALHDNAPTAATMTSREATGGTPPLRDLDLHLHLRVMTIRDGAMRLSERITPPLLAQANQYASRRAPAADPATLDGTCIALALRAGNDPPSHGGGSWQPGGPAATDLTSEAAYLCRVAEAWQTANTSLAAPPLDHGAPPHEHAPDDAA